ncbi:MAG: hypothetical protein OES47_13295, partial [Acidobacteriota bacterium]|nr:hypothetical protein [Acidobacteriota bacterium]
MKLVRSRSRRGFARTLTSCTGLALLVTMLLSSVLEGQEWIGVAGLGVEVKSGKGRALEQARVTLLYHGVFDEEAIGGPAPRTTDAKGRASFSSLALGTWTLRVEHPDHLSYVATVQLSRREKPQATSSFLEASGRGRKPIRVKLLKSQGPELGTALRVEQKTIPPSPVEPPEAPTQAPVDVPVEAPVEAPTEARMEPSAQAPMEAPAQAPVETSAQAPMEAPAQAPAEAPMEAPAEAPMEAPAQAPVEAPSEAPMEATAEAPTEAPTRASTETAREESTPIEPEATRTEPKLSPPAPRPTAPIRSTKPQQPPSPERPARKVDAEPPLPTQPGPPAAVALPPAPEPEPPKALEPPSAKPEPEPSREPAGEAVESSQDPGALPSLLPSLLPKTPEGAITSYRARTCLECKPGEWGVSSTVVASATLGDGCPLDALERAESSVEVLARHFGTGLRDFAGPLLRHPQDSSLGGLPETERANLEGSIGAFLRPDSSCRLLILVFPARVRISGFRFEALEGGRGADCNGP